MIAKCIFNTGAELGPPVPNSFFYTVKTVFHLQIGRDYRVYGLSIWKTVLLALILDDTGKPNWLPVGLFDFGNQPLPSKWEFSLQDGKAASGVKPQDGLVATWGYPELVRNPSHSDGLVERDPDALRIFFGEVVKRSESDE